jgi:hypothetical protein
VTVPQIRQVVATVGIGLLLVACAAPATEEGFNEGWCAADVKFEAAVTEILQIDDREEWIERTHDALVEFQGDVSRLPQWTGAEQMVAELNRTLNAVLDLVEAGAAGTEVGDAEWGEAITAMLSAREAVRQAAGGCVTVSQL